MGFWSRLFAAKQAVGSEQRETASAPAGDDSKRSPNDAFVAWCLQEIRQHPAVERAEAVDGPGLPVSIWTSAGEQKMFLGNTFLETRDSSPEQRLAALRRLMSVIDSAGQERDWDSAMPSLVPLLRAVTFGGTVGMGAAMVRLPFVPFLTLFIGIDEAARIAFATGKELEAWGQNPESALAQAFVNLGKHVATATQERPDSEPYDRDAPYPVWHVTRDDSYESSRITLPGYLESFRGKVLGNPIAIVPHRSMLVISGDGDPRALERLAQMAEREFNASPRSVSPAIYTTDANARVVPLRLAPDHPQHALVERGHKLLAHDIYGDQKTLLEKRFKQEGVDVFVASHMLLTDKETGKLSSASTMTEGVPSLLPETDKLALVSRSKERKVLVVARAVVADLAPECFEAAHEFDPPRIRTLSWPRPETLAELERRA